MTALPSPAERDRLAAEIAKEIDRQYKELHAEMRSEAPTHGDWGDRIRPKTLSAPPAPDEDDRPEEIVFQKQYQQVRDLLNRDVEDVLREVVPKLGICDRESRIYRVWGKTNDVAATLLAEAMLEVLLSMSLSGISLVAVGGALGAAISFRGLRAVCDRYGAEES